VDVVEVDLAEQASIRRCAAACLERYQALHVLVNNAGIWSSHRRLSPDRIELTWATNVLGYFLLTELLLERLARSAPARIVNVASERAGELDLADVQFERRPYSGVSAYSQSKQADRMFTWALARRLNGSGVTANALHPGMVRTAIFRKGGGPLAWVAALYSKLFGLSVAQGADTAAWLAVSPELEGASGKFWVRRTERACRFRDPEAEERLWRLCASMTSGR
jgi:NAD(P)-dependent dehydrogenase (short-subunit alcohol dehydrogenase family)